MLTPLREDYLEAIFIHTERHSRPPGIDDLVSILHIDVDDAHAHISELTRLGDITRLEDGGIELTAKGKTTGRQIVKRHETLQSFLSEILGMDRSSASDEACRIEHAVSDETIDRLNVYLHSPGPQVNTRNPALHCFPGLSQTCVCESANSLMNFDEGEHLIVRDVRGRGCSKRLLDLGVVPGQVVVIKRKLRNHSIVIQVKDCDVALSPENASAICVDRIP